MQDTLNWAQTNFLVTQDTHVSWTQISCISPPTELHLPLQNVAAEGQGTLRNAVRGKLRVCSDKGILQGITSPLSLQKFYSGSDP